MAWVMSYLQKMWSRGMGFFFCYALQDWWSGTM